MDGLKQRIIRDGKNLGGGILKVDSFINHQVDPALMDTCGREFAKRFAKVGATKILTAEISGIAPALMTALHLGLPVVYARKTKPITMPDQVFLTLAPSHTKGRMVELIVSPEYLAHGEKILIIDDFLATGSTIHGLVPPRADRRRGHRRHRCVRSRRASKAGAPRSASWVCPSSRLCPSSRWKATPSSSVKVKNRAEKTVDLARSAQPGEYGFSD